MKLIKASALLDVKYETLPLAASWIEMFGNLPSDFQMTIKGNPGGGKSTLAMLLANELAHKVGKVAILTYEESNKDAPKGRKKQKDFRLSVQNRIALVKKKQPLHDNFLLLQKPPENILDEKLMELLGKCDFIVVDSLQSAHVDKHVYSQLLEALPFRGWIFISQLNDKGKSGKNSIEHMVDINVKITNGLAAVTKNRYAPLKAIRIFTKQGHTLSLDV